MVKKITSRSKISNNSKNTKKKSKGKSSLKKINPHINFKREGAKTNARKIPTKVFCSKCKKEFILPFKPRKPLVYCDDCFKKKNKLS